MNTDDIFKLPPLPKGSIKRKFEAPPIPDSLSNSTSVQPTAKVARTDSNGKGKGKAVTIEEYNGSGDDEDGPIRDDEFAPNGDADYFEEEDPDGRFFGGGLNDVQKTVLNMMDAGNDEGLGGELTVQSVRKQLLAFEKGINKNRDMRTKYGNDPEKFVDSEFALLEALHALLVLSTSPALAFPILLEQSTPNSLADLLSHENADVVIAVVEVLEEWVDEEVLEGDGDEEEEDIDRKREAMVGLVNGLIESGVVELVVSSLERFDEEDEAERGGVFHSLGEPPAEISSQPYSKLNPSPSHAGLLENLLSLSPSIATSLLSPKSTLFNYLLKRIGADKLPADRDQNRFYAGEILSILLSLEVDGIQEGRKRLASGGAIDGLLRILAVYRRRDPASADEIEFMENIFDSICSALSEASVKAAFLEGEGTELMCLMLKEKKLSRTRAIKTLDHALQGMAGIPLCERFVEMLGLKTLFSAFMGKSVAIKKSSKGELTTYEDTEHLLSIVASLLTSLASESPSRIRLLAKFVESDYEKIDRLLELREDVETRVHATSAEEEPEEDLDEDDLYLAKLDKGLFSLQLVDYIIAWLCMEDDGMRDHIKMLLTRKDKSLDDVMRVLIEYRENIGDTPLPEGAVEGQFVNEGAEQREILANLLTYVQSISD